MCGYLRNKQGGGHLSKFLAGHLSKKRLVVNISGTIEASWTSQQKTVYVGITEINKGGGASQQFFSWASQQKKIALRVVALPVIEYKITFFLPNWRWTES